MTEHEEREAAMRLQEDIRVVEAAKQLSQNKFWQQFVSSLITPNIRRCNQEMENAARHMKGFAYYQKFYSTQGQLKTLELFEDLGVLVERYDAEIKGLKKLLEQNGRKT